MLGNTCIVDMPSKPKPSKGLLRWIKYLESISDEKICLSCWAEQLQPYLTEFPSKYGVSSNAVLFYFYFWIDLESQLTHSQSATFGDTKLCIRFSFIWWYKRCLLILSVILSWWILSTPNLRQEYAILLQISRDCRCDLD